MSGGDFHPDTGTFCEPLAMMRGLVSALYERRAVLDTEFHASCTSSGTSAVVENRLARILEGESDDDGEGNPEELMFRKIRKEYAYDEILGASRNISFMHMFDVILIRLLTGYSVPAGLGVRRFTDSGGNAVYTSLESLASALSEDLIAPGTIPVEYASGTVAADGTFQVCLNNTWAAQRARMLKLLRHVSVTSGGFVMRYAYSPDNERSYGASPQDAYGAVPYWTHDDVRFAGWQTPLEFGVEYRYVGFHDPDERWSLHSATELERITPDHQGCPATPDGILMFDAVDLRERDGNGDPVEDEDNTYLFDPFGMPVSSGENMFVLSSGIFASGGYGMASGLGGADTAPGCFIRGWQARNVKVIYDYESYFNFK